MDCKRKSKLADVRTNVAAGTVVYCRSSSCGGILKPDITFFGEELPDQFFKAIKQDVSKCDLVIVIGMRNDTLNPGAADLNYAESCCPLCCPLCYRKFGHMLLLSIGACMILCCVVGRYALTVDRAELSPFSSMKAGQNRMQCSCSTLD